MLFLFIEKRALLLIEDSPDNVAVSRAFTHFHSPLKFT